MPNAGVGQGKRGGSRQVRVAFTNTLGIPTNIVMHVGHMAPNRTTRQALGPTGTLGLVLSLRLGTLEAERTWAEARPGRGKQGVNCYGDPPQHTYTHMGTEAILLCKQIVVCIYSADGRNARLKWQGHQQHRQTCKP